MTLSSSQHPRFTSHQLLVSVQSAEEAAVALAAGVEWIDLKDPKAGALGRPSLPLAIAVADCLEQQGPTVKRSVALGEWLHWQPESTAGLMQRFPIVKFGLAGTAGNLHVDDPQFLLLKCQADQCGCQIVWAHYADWQLAGGPPPGVVLDLVQQFRSPYLLIDTWDKSGLGLFNWISFQELLRLQAQAAAVGATLVAAGSLRPSDWPLLEQLPPCILGVRGAVCQWPDDRQTQLDPRRLSNWLGWINSRVSVPL